MMPTMPPDGATMSRRLRSSSAVCRAVRRPAWRIPPRAVTATETALPSLRLRSTFSRALSTATLRLCGGDLLFIAVETGNDLPLLDPIAGVDQNFGQIAGRLRRHGDRADRLAIADGVQPVVDDSAIHRLRDDERRTAALPAPARTLPWPVPGRPPHPPALRQRPAVARVRPPWQAS